MCDDCGCGDPEIVPIEVQESLFANNNHRAEHNRAHTLLQLRSERLRCCDRFDRTAIRNPTFMFNEN